MLVINPQTASGSLAAALLAEEEYDDVLAPLPSVAEAEAAAEEVRVEGNVSLGLKLGWGLWSMKAYEAG